MSVEWLGQYLHLELFTVGETHITPLTLLLFFLTIAVAAALGRLLRRFATRMIARKGAASEGAAYAVGRIAQYLVLLAGVMLALDNVGVDMTTLTALGAVISVGIGFGLQNITQNFVSGIILLIERPVQKGDYVHIGDTEGTVADIEMRATRVITRDGISVLVPNSKLISDEVRNLSAPNPQNRLHVSVGVAYGSDTKLVRDALLEVAMGDGRVRKDPKPAVAFTDFGDSSLDFELRVWLDDPHVRPQVASDLRFAIDASFRTRGITIPFPQRDLHLVSGLETLRDAS